jgi:S-formylglutathione hydrolase FrmB
VLQGNPWNDPVDRQLCVYLPPGYGESSPAVPVLWDLAAFTNSGLGHLNWRHRGENLPQRLDRLIASGRMPPVVVAMPDCFTSLGGNQYINSTGVGRYADYVIEELIPLVEEELNVVRGPAGRGAFGKSSGGYGALVLAMRFPGVWGAVAAHAGDIGFDWVYRPGFPVACRVLEAFGGDATAFLRQFWARHSGTADEYTTLLTLAMAASYDPDPEQPENLRLPFDLHTCELKPERWARWLDHDPLRMVERHADGLRALRALYIDVGNRDEYHIQFGTRAFVSRLDDLAIDHHFEEFEGTHRNLDWRLDFSLPLLASALQPQ